MPPRKQPPQPKPQPTRVIGDLNAPYLSVKFGGLLPELVGVGDNWTVALASKYLAAMAKDTVPGEEVREIFLEAFLPSNPDLDARFYPVQSQWEAVSSFFAYRLANLQVTTEVIRNQPMQLKRASSG